jgi:hypothetical protein
VLAENLSYTLVQVVHNFGAAAVVGVPVLALASAAPQLHAQRRLLWFTLLAWSAQALSGAGFGAVSRHFYGQFPDISPVATGALAVKVACAVLGFALVAAALRWIDGWPVAARQRAWRALAGLGALALTAAAVLRWFS